MKSLVVQSFYIAIKYFWHLSKSITYCIKEIIIIKRYSVQEYYETIKMDWFIPHIMKTKDEGLFRI